MMGLWLISYIALWVLVVVLVVVVLGLVRQLGVIHVRLGPDDKLATTREGLELGSLAPDFHAVDAVQGKEISLSDLKGRQSVLVFVSPSCGPCIQLMPHLARFHHEFGKKVNVVLFSQGSQQAVTDMVAMHKLKSAVVADPLGEVAQTYQARATPFAYRLDANGRVQRRGIVNDFDALEALLERSSPSDRLIDLPPSITMPPKAP